MKSNKTPPEGGPIVVGTSGYSYKEWLGSFYPLRTPAAEMLPFYSARFSAVEINNTFYRMPKRSVLEAWTTQVPPSFQFVLKAPQRITHMKRLKDVGEDTAYLLDTALALGQQLGAVLFQLAERTKKDAPRLEEFVALLPPSPAVAFEFRHDSWFDEEIYQILRSHNIALCAADTDEGTTPLVSTADWGYLRLRRAEYTAADLEAWRQRINDQRWSRAFLFFKHEDEAKGPRFATQFLELP